MAGQWVEDSRYSSGWRWDTSAPVADPSVTRISNVYAGGSPMTDQTPRSVYDPRLGNDGGGRYAEPDPIPAIDPDNPVDHVDQLRPDDGPAYWTGSDPQHRDLDRLSMPGEVAGVMACPTCGTGVHPDRIRE